MKESRFGLAQYLVAELMAVVERRRRRTNCCAAAERERERENRKWSEIERMATRDSDSDQRFRFNGDDDLGGDGGKWFGGRSAGRTTKTHCRWAIFVSLNNMSTMSDLI